MRKSLISLAAAAAVGGFALSVSAETLILNSGYPDNNYHTINIREFAKDVKSMTNGKLEIDVHSAQELFKLRETKQAIQTGQIPMGEIMMPGYGNEHPLFLLSGVPFLIASYDDAKKLWKATKPHLETYLDKQGLKLLFVVPWPVQGFYTKTPVSKAADFKGLKFRAYSPATARLGELLGALPTIRRLAISATSIPLSCDARSSTTCSCSSARCCSSVRAASASCSRCSASVRASCVASRAAVAWIIPQLVPAIPASSTKRTMLAANTPVRLRRTNLLNLYPTPGAPASTGSSVT